MFQQRLRPLEEIERRVAALRYSLNEPSISTAEVPAGPARAAIVVYIENKARHVIVVIRSLVRPRIVQYQAASEEYQDATGMAWSAALSFAESMGFVFDDECLASAEGSDRLEALVTLHHLLDPSSKIEPRQSAEEIVVEADPLVDSGLDLDLDLTKFREPASEAAAGATGPTALGRVQPVRRLAAPKASMSATLRLLASF